MKLKTVKVKVNLNNPNFFEDLINECFKEVKQNKHPRDEKGRFTSRQKFEEKKVNREINKFLEGLDAPSLPLPSITPLLLRDIINCLFSDVVLIRNGFKLKRICPADLVARNSNLLDTEVLSIRSRNSKDSSYIEILLK